MPRKPRPPTPDSIPEPVTVDTAPALQLVHTGINSSDPRLSNAAETLLSALTLHLRHPTATLPSAVGPAIARLLEQAK